MSASMEGRATMSARTPRTTQPAGNGEVLAPLVQALGSLVQAGVREQPFQRDPAFIEQVRPLVRGVNRYFDTEFRGWEHVPRTPCLIVGNHSGGAGSNDFAFLLYKWIEERGSDAPLYSLTYDLLFGAPLIGPALRRLGCIPANHVNARRALAMGASVAVFPGGDYEVFRPWQERNRIDFGGHTGFIRLAIAARVPVVPMTIHGAHQSTLVLTRGHDLAHAVGIDRLHVNVFPVVWSIPFGPVPAFVPSVQLPSTVTVQFGPPLDWSRYPRSRADDPAVLRACYAEITARMQRTMSRLAHQHPHPILERLRHLDTGARSATRTVARGFTPAAQAQKNRQPSDTMVTGASRLGDAQRHA
jgi:1-acyl-sn-glycerol-3-phosphate acyltransferase